MLCNESKASILVRMKSICILAAAAEAAKSFDFGPSDGLESHRCFTGDISWIQWVMLLPSVVAPSRINYCIENI